MKCDICRRDLSADEPIWHFRPGHTIWRDLTDFRNEGVACEQCKAKPPKRGVDVFRRGVEATVGRVATMRTLRATNL
jgi:hypothetical protein